MLSKEKRAAIIDAMPMWMCLCDVVVGLFNIGLVIAHMALFIYMLFISIALMHYGPGDFERQCIALLTFVAALMFSDIKPPLFRRFRERRIAELEKEEAKRPYNPVMWHKAYSQTIVNN